MDNTKKELDEKEDILKAMPEFVVGITRLIYEEETGRRLRLDQGGRISALRRPNMMMYSFFPPIVVFQRSFYGRLLEKRHYYIEKIMRNVFRGFALYIDGRFQL